MKDLVFLIFKNGFVTTLIVPEGNAADSPQLVPLVKETIKNTGVTPSKSMFYSKSNTIRTTIPAEYCNSCEQRKNCPVKRAKRGFRIAHTAKDRRLEKRRKKEATDEFRKVYSKRSGIESTNSGIKRRTGMSRLRVRGKESVFQAMILRMAGWNIFQAAKTEKAREYVRKAMADICQQSGKSILNMVSNILGLKSPRIVHFISLDKIKRDWLNYSVIRQGA